MITSKYIKIENQIKKIAFSWLIKISLNLNLELNRIFSRQFLLIFVGTRRFL